MIRFSASEVARFRHQSPLLRYGQAFHQYFKLDRVTGEDKIWCDRLYQADDETARRMINEQTDKNQ